MAGAKGYFVSPCDIGRIPVLSDNYVWLVHDRASKATMVVDPAVAAPVLEAAAARGRRFQHGFRSEEHTSELQSLMSHSYAVSCLNNNPIATAKLRTTLFELAASTKHNHHHNRTHYLNTTV